MAIRPDRTLAVFGDRVRRLRLAAAMSQEALAHDAGIDRTYLGGLERGKRNPSLLIVLSLAKALRVDPIDLLGK